MTGLAGRDIICLSTHYWDERWFRKQEFMSRFARANRVLFVDPSFSMARAPERHLRRVADNRFLLPRLEQRGGGLHLLKPPRSLPKWSDPRVERLTYRWYGHVVGRAVRRLDLREAILWVYRPSFYHGLAAIPHRHMVFDLTDDLSAYGGNEAGAPHVESCVASLVQASDLLVVTAKTLLERYGCAAKRVEHVPNGFDASRFAPRGITTAPPGLASVPPPILGFIGTIFTFLDFDLFERIARVHSDKSLVLVGPVEASARPLLERLARLPNVHHIGPQPQDSIPSFIDAFHVCLNVFRPGRATDSVIPLKVFEYLAGGKPVVSTAMRGLAMEDVAAHIAFADSPVQFCNEIERCLAEQPGTAADKRREAVAPYSWNRLFERLDAACGVALGA